MTQQDNDKQSNDGDQPDPGDRTWIVTNETAYRIGIKACEGNSKLIIPPFASRDLSDKIRQQFDLDAWKQRNLIAEVQKSNQNDDERIMAIAGFLFLGFIAFLLVAIPLAFFSRIDWGFVLYVSISFVILIVLTFWYALRPKSAKTSESFWSRLVRKSAELVKNLPSLIILLSIAIGIPVGVVYFFGGGMALWAQAQSGTTTTFLLWRGMQLVFVCIASFLPALMYFIFGRQKLEQEHDKFIREVMMLDPSVQTTSEAKTKYNPLFYSVYIGSGPLDSLPIYISTTLITFGWILILLPIGESLALADNNLAALFVPYVTALNFGFLGAYYFTINMLFRRYIRADLNMKAYAHVTIRLLTTIILVWVLSASSELLGVESGTTSSAILLLAFVTGIFPETGVTVIQDLVRKTFGTAIDPLKEQHPLTKLEGINLYDQTRLLEEGIENIENLAHHNLVDLMVRTPVPTPRLVDLFDQAILYMHLGLDVGKLEETRQQLREYGIRTATDLLKVMKESSSLLSHDETLEKRLKVIEVTLSDDEWITYLEHWRSASTEIDDIKTLEQFELCEFSVKKRENPIRSVASESPATVAATP